MSSARASGWSSSASTKLGFSKYDFVKVRVYLSTEHYYVLSRYLTCRVLTAARVPYTHAVRIALDLKKQLVDRNLLELQQSELERHLFEILRRFGYGGPATIQLYQMMARFHHQRIPLVILIGGTGCVGKSSLATYLAERLNLPSVLQTDLVHETIVYDMKKTTPTWYQSHPLDCYAQDCQDVEKCLRADIEKCLREGKSILIEGCHVRPSLYASILDSLQSSPSSSSTTSNQAALVGFLLVSNVQAPAHRQQCQRWLDCQPPKYQKLLGETESEQCDTVQNNHDALQQLLLQEWQTLPAHAQMHLISTSDMVEQDQRILDRMHACVIERMQKVTGPFSRSSDTQDNSQSRM